MPLHRRTRVLIQTFTLDLLSSYSLKDKRRLRQRVVERLKQRYNLSIIESFHQDHYRLLELTVAYVALSETVARQMQGRIEETLLSLIAGEAELLESDYEIV